MMIKNPPLSEMEEFFKDHIPLDGPIKLSPGEVINDPKHFIEDHVYILKNNSGNRRMMPFYSRLLKYYNLVKTKK